MIHNFRILRKRSDKFRPMVIVEACLVYALAYYLTSNDYKKLNRMVKRHLQENKCDDHQGSFST